MKIFALRLLLVLALVPGFVVRAEAPDPRAGLLDPARVLESAAAVTREAYPDADVVAVNGAQVAEYAPDGTAVERFDYFAKALTEKGRRDLSTFRFGFNVSYGGIEIHRVTVFKPGGETVEVDVARFSREMVAPDQINENIFDPNKKILAVGVPGLEIGDVVRVVGTRRTTRARMADTWADYATFEDEWPIVEETYEVRAPKARPLAHKRLRDEVPGTVAYESQETETAVIHRWRVRNVPRMFEEPNMPAPYTVVQRLLVSTIPDWPTVSRWYWELSRPRLEAVSPELREKARELKESASDDEARLRAIFFWVAQNIQYLGITTETVAPGYEPRDVGATFEKRSGVCRDKAALLVAMLREAGFEAFPVLITVGPLMDAEVPLPFFNHAIAAVRRPDGSFELMDPTDETATELFPPHLNHRSYLVATPEGEPLRVSPVIPAERNMVDIETRAQLAADGEVRGVSTLRFAGLNDNAYRGYFTSIKPEERRRFFEGLVKRVLPGATLTAFALSPENLLDMSEPLTARLEFSAADALIAGEGVAVPPTPWFGTSVGLVNFALGQTGLARRRYPLYIENACGVRERFELDVSAALAGPLSLPAAPAVEDKNIVWRQSLAHDAATGRLTGAAEFRLETVEFSPPEYLDLKAALERIAFARRKRPIFEPRAAAAPPAAPAPAAPAADGAAAADVEVLEQVTEYDVASASEWTVTETVRKKVLTFAAIRPHSVIKVPFNSGWESVEVVYARATDARGQTREAADHDINVMDAPWVAAAPRYPASRLLTVSLPGVEVGGIIEYRLRRALRERPFFAAMETFGGHEPVARRVVRLRAPADLPLEIRATPGAPAETLASPAEGVVELTWSAEGLPAMPREDAQPPLWALTPTLFISAPDAAAQYAKTLEDALSAAAKTATEVAAAAREIAAANPDGAAVRAIRDAVARRIRRAGPAVHEAPLAAITSADVVWRDGYGNSADAAVVLAAMLRAVGERPEFVLAASLRPAGPTLRMPFEVFQPSLFPEMLVRVRRGDEWVYLNDTDQYAALGATPREGALGLVTHSGALETIEPPADRRAETRVRYAIALEADGAALLRVTREYGGPSHGEMAKTYAELSPEERRRRHQELVAEIAQDATAEGELEANFEVYPGRESFAVRIPRYAIADGSFLYFTLPLLETGSPRLRADTRRTPLYWDRLERQTASVAVILPPAHARARLLPPERRRRFAGGWTEATAAFTEAAGAPTLTVQRAAEWTPALLPPETYAELLEMQRELTHPRMRFVLLSRED